MESISKGNPTGHNYNYKIPEQHHEPSFAERVQECADSTLIAGGLVSVGLALPLAPVIAPFGLALAGGHAIYSASESIKFANVEALIEKFNELSSALKAGCVLACIPVVGPALILAGGVIFSIYNMKEEVIETFKKAIVSQNDELNTNEKAQLLENLENLKSTIVKIKDFIISKKERNEMIKTYVEPMHREIARLVSKKNELQQKLLIIGNQNEDSFVDNLKDTFDKHEINKNIALIKKEIENYSNAIRSIFETEDQMSSLIQSENEKIIAERNKIEEKLKNM